MPRSENLQRAVDLVRTELDQFRAGEVSTISSNAHIRELLGISSLGGFYEALKEEGLFEDRRELAFRQSYPRPRQSSRATELREFIREEIHQFRSGESQRISSTRELQERFGYSNINAVGPSVRDKELWDERRQVLKDIFQERLVPSPELAWLLGILSASAGRNPSSKKISLFNRNEQVVSRFAQLGEQVFKINARINDRGTTKVVEYYKSDLVESIGKLFEENWSEIIMERHRWVVERPEFAWSFMSGYFDKRGNVRADNNKFSIGFRQHSERNITFLRDLLNTLGVENTRVAHNLRRGLLGIELYNLVDIKLVAENIHSQIPEKEEKLGRIRNYSIKFPTENFNNPVTEEELIKEWLYLTNFLGRLPTSMDINDLKKQRKTRFSTNSYTKRFGIKDQKKSFKYVRENMERIIRQKKAPEDNVEPLSPEGQVFP